MERNPILKPGLGIIIPYQVGSLSSVRISGVSFDVSVTVSEDVLFSMSPTTLVLWTLTRVVVVAVKRFSIVSRDFDDETDTVSIWCLSLDSTQLGTGAKEILGDGVSL